MPQREKFKKNKYYHIYNRGLHKQTLFHVESDFKRFMKFAEKYEEKCKNDFKILAYCILPNHFHFVFHNKIEGYKMSYFIGNICAAYARYYQFKYRIPKGSAYFENRFKCKEIEDSDYLRQCIRYVENNPYKHGIVDKNEKWIFKSATDVLPGAEETHCNLGADLEGPAPGSKTNWLLKN